MQLPERRDLKTTLQLVQHFERRFFVIQSLPHEDVRDKLHKLGNVKLAA